MVLGMLIPEFPTQTHSFFWHEIEAIRALGATVRIISTKRPAERCPHAFADLAIGQTYYVFPPGLGIIFDVLRKPGEMVGILRYIMSIAGGTRRRIKLAMLSLCAVDLLRWCQREQITHIHVHSCADAAHIVAMARILGGPTYSLHLHGDLAVYGTDHRQKFSMVRFAAAAASPMRKEIVDTLALEESDVHTLWMGVDTAKFSQLQPRKPQSNYLHMVSISRLHVCKGHVYTLRAMRDLVAEGLNIKYSIAGSGPHQAEIAEEVAKLGLSDHVNFVGSLGEVEVMQLLQQADLFVLSSIGIGEASPVAVMEAMASGLPVICSIIGGTQDMIQTGEDGILVSQQSPGEITDAIKSIYCDADLRSRLGVNARIKAKQQFDCAVTAKKLFDLVCAP